MSASRRVVEGRPALDVPDVDVGFLREEEGDGVGGVVP